MAIKVETVKLSEIHKLEDNPRKISKDDFERLKKSLKEFPEMLDVREIVVDENGTILGGNQRYEALKANGVTEAVVKRVTGWSEERKREFVIRDNVINGEWDNKILADKWDQDELLEFGMFDVKEGIKDEKEIKEKPPRIISSFITFDYADEVEQPISEEIAQKLMEKMLGYRQIHGSYDGFWNERIGRDDF